VCFEKHREASSTPAQEALPRKRAEEACPIAKPPPSNVHRFISAHHEESFSRDLMRKKVIKSEKDFKKRELRWGEEYKKRGRPCGLPLHFQE